jgi:hypothetical protein
MGVGAGIAGVVVAGLAALAGRAWLRWRVPAEIPPERGFTHEIDSDRPLRELAEELARRFPSGQGVWCLGPVRGNAGRVLFHSGPQNRRGNLWRPDYVLHLRRVGKGRVALVLEVNRIYSHPWLRAAELDPLVAALRRAYGGLGRV